MSIPNEALQKVMQEIQDSAVFSQQQLQVVKAQMAAKQRDIRLLQLTATELDGMPKETRVYEGIGKMFVMEDVAAIKGRLGAEKKGLEGDISDLKKKYQYLETTFEKAQQNLDQILNRGR